MPEIVATGVRFAEGPVWCPDGDGGALVCTSVADGTLVRIHLADGTVERVAHVGGGANSALLASDGGFAVTQNGGIDFSAMPVYADDPPAYRPVTPGIQRVAPDGTVTYLADRDFRAPNDLVVAPDGVLWFTDPPRYPPPDEPAGRVHTMAADGSTSVVADGFVYCNGIALEPEGTFVVVEARGLVRMAADGTREWIVERLGATPGDGLCLDTDGRLYIASTGEHGVRVLEPDGREVEFLAISGEGLTTNCCFGGDDGRTLFATDGLPSQIVAWEAMPAPGLPVHPWPAP